MICTTNCTLTTARIDAKSKFNTIFLKNCIDNSEICKIIVVWGITTMNNYEFLEKLGFSSNEAKVYGTLIKHKVLNGYEIAKLSGVARSLVYEVINRLVAKGAVIRIDGEPNFTSLSSIKTLYVASRKKTKRILPAPNASYNNLQRKTPTSIM